MTGTGPVFEIDPGCVGRCAWEADETRRDVEVLVWVGRFRFVTAQAISRRFLVSWQRANARVRRLERHGLLGGEREHVSQPRAIYLTGRGHELLGWPRRRAPRAQVQREHEDAIVALVTDLELHAPDGFEVLTERECRQLEAAGEARYSVDAFAGRGSQRRRWPDVVVQAPGGRRAIEIEFAPKGTQRLRQIVHAYEASTYREARFMVKDAALGRRIKSLAGGPSARRLDPTVPVCQVKVVPWTGLSAADRTALASRLDGEHASMLA